MSMEWARVNDPDPDDEEAEDQPFLGLLLGLVQVPLNWLGLFWDWVRGYV